MFRQVKGDCSILMRLSQTPDLKGRCTRKGHMGGDEVCYYCEGCRLIYLLEDLGACNVFPREALFFNRRQEAILEAALV